jgi:hypothetical protein
MTLHTAMVMVRGSAAASDQTMFVPLLGARRQVRGLTAAASTAARMIAEATGEAVTDGEVEVLVVPPGAVLLPSEPTPVEVCHPPDRTWYPGTRTGWANQLGRPWRPVVRYTVGAVQWERVVAPGRWRPVRTEARSAGVAGKRPGRSRHRLRTAAVRPSS